MSSPIGRLRRVESGDAAAAADADARPWVSMLLIAYRQAGTVGEAVAGALAQTYSPLEIIVSDDASDDATWDAIEAALAGYKGPHRIVRNRNARNLVIGAHLSKLAAIARGELLFVTAGDDVSRPERCERTVQAWLAHGRRPDLIASPLLDIDARGEARGLLRPSDLGVYRSAAAWIAKPPYVIGAGQAWTRRLVERFGPLPEGTVAEDLVMVFRAVVSGGAITLAEPLVAYRRGGLSRRRRALHAREVRHKLLANARHALVELPCLLRDAERAGVRDQVAPTLERQLARERHVAAQFDASASLPARCGRLLGDRAVPAATRLRVFVYAALPWLLAPGFALKRLALGRREPE